MTAICGRVHGALRRPDRLDHRPADRPGNFQHNIASRLTDMVPTEHDVIQTSDMLVIRGTYEVTHSGEFLGVPPTGRRVSYDWVDMYRVTGGRVVWRYLLCDWKGLLVQLRSGGSLGRYGFR